MIVPSIQNHMPSIMDAKVSLHPPQQRLSPKRQSIRSVKHIVHPAEMDILCGKDKNYNKHPGNRVFRDLIDSMVEPYTKAFTKQEKMRFTRDIVASMKEKYSSRFLRRILVEGSYVWQEINDSLARDKVSHALRFAASQQQQPTVTPPITTSATTSAENNKGSSQSLIETLQAKPLDHKNDISTIPQAPKSMQTSKGALIDYTPLNGCWGYEIAPTPLRQQSFLSSWCKTNLPTMEQNEGPLKAVDIFKGHLLQRNESISFHRESFQALLRGPLLDSGFDLPRTFSIGSELPRTFSIGSEFPRGFSIGSELPYGFSIGSEFNSMKSSDFEDILKESAYFESL